MIGNVLDKNPDQFRTAFDDVLVDKIAASLETRKQEVSQNMFVTSEEETEEESTDDSNTDSTEDENGQDENSETNA